MRRTRHTRESSGLQNRSKQKINHYNWLSDTNIHLIFVCKHYIKHVRDNSALCRCPAHPAGVYFAIVAIIIVINCTLVFSETCKYLYKNSQAGLVKEEFTLMLTKWGPHVDYGAGLLSTAFYCSAKHINKAANWMRIRIIKLNVWNECKRKI